MLQVITINNPLFLRRHLLRCISQNRIQIGEQVAAGYDVQFPAILGSPRIRQTVEMGFPEHVVPVICRFPCLDEDDAIVRNFLKN